MAATIHTILLGLVWVAVFVSGILWLRFFYRRLRSETHVGELVPVQPRKQPFWTLADFFMMFFMLVGGLLIFSAVFATESWAEPFGTTEQPSLHRLVGNIIANGFAGIVAVAVTCGWLCVLQGKSAIVELGLIARDSDVKLGFKAALWMLPPIGLISLIVSLAVPYEHPVLDTLTESPTLLLFALMFMGTAIVAPIVEEFMFRVLLQGSLERAATIMAENRAAADIAHKTDTMGTSSNESGEPRTPHAQVAANWAPRFYWPMVVTSLIFAMMHVGQGAAPIPLFVLSLGLCYLYRQTGRIAAPLIVHMVLNSTTLLVEFSRIMAASGTPSP